MVGQRHSRTAGVRNTCLAASVLAGLAACAGAASPTAEAPEVRLTNLRPSMGGPLGGKFLADLRLTNPSPQRLTVDGVTFNLSLGGALLASGVRNQPLSIAPRADAALTIEARSVSPAVVAHLFALGGGDGVPFTIRGEVYRQGRTDETMPYAANGTLDLFAGGLAGTEPHYRARPF